MLCHHQIAVLYFMPRVVIYFRFLFSAVLLSLSMAEASVAIPPDVLEAARLGAIPPLNLLLVVQVPHCPLKGYAIFIYFFTGVLLPLYGLRVMQNQGWSGLFWLTYIAFSVGLVAFGFSMFCFCGG